MICFRMETKEGTRSVMEVGLASIMLCSKWSDAPITCTRWRVRRGVQCVEGAGERRRGLLAGRACTPHRVRLRISEDVRTGVWG